MTHRSPNADNDLPARMAFASSSNSLHPNSASVEAALPAQ